jgi:hypothetical protein
VYVRDAWSVPRQIAQRHVSELMSNPTLFARFRNDQLKARRGTDCTTA